MAIAMATTMVQLCVKVFVAAWLTKRRESESATKSVALSEKEFAKTFFHACCLKKEEASYFNSAW